MKTTELSRRQFLKGAGALVVSFNLFPTAAKVFAQSASTTPGDLDPQSLDSWLAIAQDGTVTIFTSKVELGTGIETALAQIAAEELDVSWKHVKVVMGDTALTVDQSATGGSRTIERAGPQIRQAAAAARKELLRLAAEKLGAPADLKLAHDVQAKSVKEYATVGTTVPRFDLPPKVTGEAVYIHDVRVPGMLHGRPVRPPVINTDPISIDEGSIRTIPGVVMIVREGKFVGVVAQTEWAAIRAAQSLKVTWSKPATKLPANAEEVYAYLKNTKPMRSQKAVDKGNMDTAFSQAKKTY